jgi:hypothetical protein
MQDNNRITKDKVEVHKILNRADITDKVWIEIETLQ